ncbi:hypothetical protein ACQPZX_41325 [Actinoplanes sp. CA-142083]
MAQDRWALNATLANMTAREQRAARQGAARREDRSAMVRSVARGRRGI